MFFQEFPQERVFVGFTEGLTTENLQEMIVPNYTSVSPELTIKITFFFLIEYTTHVVRRCMKEQNLRIYMA